MLADPYQRSRFDAMETLDDEEEVRDRRGESLTAEPRTHLELAIPSTKIAKS